MGERAARRQVRSRVQRLVGPLAAGVCLGLLGSPTAASAAVDSDPKPDPSSIANSIAADPSRIVGAGFVGQQYTGTPGPVGIGDTALAGFPTVGPSFAVMTTGNAEFADDPNNSNSTGRQNGIGPPVLERGTKAFDYTVLKVDVIVPISANCVAFDFRFASEEYPEYLNKGYNDAFIAEIDRTTWVANDEQGLHAPDDIAASSGDVVSVDTLGPTAMTAENAAGTTYDGATGLLSARARITPGKHSIYFSVLDYGDASYDSAVFLDNLRFGFAPEGTCSFSGAGDENPPNLIVCGPVGSPLPPCGGLLPPPRPLTVCGPKSGTILPSCEGLALGLGPKPFLGSAAWERIEVKCDDSAGFCNVDVDAELDPKNNPALTKFGGEPGVRPAGSARNALKLANQGLAEASYDNFDALRALGDVTGRLLGEGANGGWHATALSAVNADLAEEFALDNDMVGLGQQAVDGITKPSLADFAAAIVRGAGGLRGTAPMLSLNPQPAGDLADDLAKQNGKLIQGIQTEMQKTQQAWDQLSQLTPQLSRSFFDKLGVTNGLMDQVMASMKPAFDQLASGIRPQTKQWGGLQELVNQNSSLMQRLTQLGVDQNLIAGTIIGRIGGSEPPAAPNETAQAMLQVQDQMNKVNQMTAVLATNQTGLHGIFSSLRPTIKLMPGIMGSFTASISRMHTDLLTSIRLNGVFEEMAPLAFPQNGTQSQVNNLNPNNIGSGPQLQKIQATLNDVSRYFQFLNTSMTKLSKSSQSAIINNLVPRAVAAKPKGKKKTAIQLGSTEAVLAPGQKGKLKLEFTKRARGVLKRARKAGVDEVVVRLVVRVGDASDNTAKKSFKFKIPTGKRKGGGK